VLRLTTGALPESESAQDSTADRFARLRGGAEPFPAMRLCTSLWGMTARRLKLRNGFVTLDKDRQELRW
jgi:hypothetical protein